VGGSAELGVGSEEVWVSQWVVLVVLVTASRLSLRELVKPERPPCLGVHGLKFEPQLQYISRLTYTGYKLLGLL